jgi:hypothetical protein
MKRRIVRRRLAGLIVIATAAGCGQTVILDRRSPSTNTTTGSSTGTGGAPAGRSTGTGGAPTGSSTGTGGAPTGSSTGTGGAPAGSSTGTGGVPAGSSTSTGGASSTGPGTGGATSSTSSTGTGGAGGGLVTGQCRSMSRRTATACRRPARPPPTAPPTSTASAPRVSAGRAPAMACAVATAWTALATTRWVRVCPFPSDGVQREAVGREFADHVETELGSPPSRRSPSSPVAGGRLCACSRRWRSSRPRPDCSPLRPRTRCGRCASRRRATITSPTSPVPLSHEWRLCLPGPRTPGACCPPRSSRRSAGRARG